MHTLSSSLKLALRPWKQSTLGQWCSIVTLGFILTTVSFAVHLARGFQALERRLGQEQIATVYLASGGEDGKKAEVADEIRVRLGSAARSIERVSAEEFMRTIEKSHPELAAEVGSLGADVKLITPEYVTVRGTIAPADAEKLKGISGVEAVDLSTERMRPLLTQVHSFRLTLTSIALLLIGAFLVVMNLLSQVNRNLHRESEALVAQLGGSKLQVKLPAIGDLALTGLLAGMVAMFLWSISDAIVLRQLGSWSPLFRELPKLSPLNLLSLPLAGLVLGLVNGNLRGLKTRV